MRAFRQAFRANPAGLSLALALTALLAAIVILGLLDLAAYRITGLPILAVW